MSPKLFVLVLCAACYGPDVPECTLACTADTDCISGQACSVDGFCAASPTTRCAQLQSPLDGAPPERDAGGSDSETGSGSGSGSGIATVTIHVTVHGPGMVVASTGATCATDCMFQVAQGVAMTLTAAPTSHHHFESWSGACLAQPALCHLTPTTALTAGARFVNGD